MVTAPPKRHQVGQTLVEFAITLPVLLMLIFGIIEFARVFQAWVTLQHAASQAARYASTGQYLSDFAMDTVIDTADLNDETGFIPCVDDGSESFRTYGTADQRGSVVSNFIVPGSDYTYKVYEGGLESLYATWYDGENCDPRKVEHQEKRKDLARIVSIMIEARRNAAGLAVEQSNWNIPADKTSMTGWPWTEPWLVPAAREDTPAWFNVVLCSTRPKLVRSSDDFFQFIGDGGAPVDITSRFVLYLGNGTLRTADGDDLTRTSTPELPIIGCMLNEDPAETGGHISNAGKPWMDAGGPGDMVTVVLTFNHPLITPLGLGRYIRIQSRRSAVIESFRIGLAQNVLGEIGVNIIQPPATSTPTVTPTSTFTPTATLTPSETWTPTITNTPLPVFDCASITLSALVNTGTPPTDGLFGNKVRLQVSNDNFNPIILTRAMLSWPTIVSYPGMYVSELSLGGIPHWAGVDVQNALSATNTTDTSLDVSVPPNYFASVPEADRTIAGESNQVWEGNILNGPLLLSNYVSIYNFYGTTLYFTDPISHTDCAVVLNVPPPTLTPTPNGTPTYTPTPDCTGTVALRFLDFQPFGIVRFQIDHYRTAVSSLVSFRINWNVHGASGITLSQVAMGPFNDVLIWQSGSAIRDNASPTNSTTEGVWVTNFNLPAGSPSSTIMNVDFDGVAGTMANRLAS